MLSDGNSSLLASCMHCRQRTFRHALNQADCISRAYMPCTTQKCIFCGCVILISCSIAACICPMHVLHIVSTLLMLAIMERCMM